MAKKVKLNIKSQAPAGQANPASLGSTLGPAGINIMEFCKAFNAHTQSQGIEQGTPVPVVITVYEDRSFTFFTKQPPVSYFLKKFAKVQKGSSLPGRQFVAKIAKALIYEIIELKKSDLNSRDKEGAYEMIKGSALSMGIQVEE